MAKSYDCDARQEAREKEDEEREQDWMINYKNATANAYEKVSEKVFSYLLFLFFLVFICKLRAKREEGGEEGERGGGKRFFSNIFFWKEM